METIDLKKTLKTLYAPSARDFALVDVPPLNFLMIDGAGDPNSAPAYSEAVEALYALAYALKFQSKREQGRDYSVMPLEGLWWSDDMATFSVERKGDWRWTMMILQPDWITAEQVAAMRAETERKKGLPALSRIRFEQYHEGLSFQILHIGSYADEAPTLYRLHHEVMPAQGYEFAGNHHEIYLSDPRRTDPAKLKTILRQPVRPVAEGALLADRIG